MKNVRGSVDGDDIVGTNVLCEWLGCSRVTVSQYERRGILIKRARGQWALRASIRAVCQHLLGRGTEVTAGDEPDDPQDLIQQRSLLAHAQRRKLEREEQEAMAQLLDGNAARAAWTAERRVVRDALMALPDKVGPMLVDAPNVHAVRMALVNEITATLQALADGDAPAEDAA